MCKKIMRLELRTKARDAHKALQNITTSTNALRSPNKGKETSAGSQQTAAYGSEPTQRSTNWALKFFVEKVFLLF